MIHGKLIGININSHFLINFILVTFTFYLIIFLNVRFLLIFGPIILIISDLFFIIIFYIKTNKKKTESKQ